MKTTIGTVLVFASFLTLSSASRSQNSGSIGEPMGNAPKSCPHDRQCSLLPPPHCPLGPPCHAPSAFVKTLPPLDSIQRAK